MGPHAWRTVFVLGLLVAGGLWAGRAYSTGRLPVAAPLVVDHAFEERADTVARNETLSDLFARHGIMGADLIGLLGAADEIDPRRVRPGLAFEFRYPVGRERAERVRVRVNPDLFLNLTRGADGAWRAEREQVTWTVHTERLEGEIASSLYETMDGLIPDSILPRPQRSELVWDLAEGVYAWQIDFTRDNYPGDGFAVLFERLVSSLGEVRYGRILAARIDTRGRENLAFVMTDDRGRNAYYDQDGRSLRRAFLMYPVRFRRISSGFSRGRFHPVLRTYRAHLGTDYAANYGTPIEATGDGTVTRAGRWGGYGLVVTIRHPKGIETRYAHMSRIAPGIRPGVRVSQGQWIGNVGATGLANGPHVHYEFLKNGRHVDHRRVDLGDGEPVPADRREEFEAIRSRYARFLGVRSTEVAEVD